MKNSPFTEAQIVSALKKQISSIAIRGGISRELGITESVFYNWKAMYDSMELSDVKKMKPLKEENTRLKKMYANLTIDDEILNEPFAKKGWALPQ